MVAHLAYFEQTYVRQKRWISHRDFSHLVALCQLLPGPTSSQLNFLVGLRQAGWLGAILSWVGFTLPSALLMYSFAIFAPRINGFFMEAALHGLKLVAVSIVAHAVWTMAPRLCPDHPRITIALTAMIMVFLIEGAFGQVAAISLGAVIGLFFCRNMSSCKGSQIPSISSKKGWTALTFFFILLVALPLLAVFLPAGWVSLMDISYRSGALVFGGGHVVLPLLRDAMVPTGMVTDDLFLAGYGLAQGIPGPLFSLVAYLGVVAAPGGGATILWSTTALIFIFLPGLLAAIAGVSFWQWLVKHPALQGALSGINASVVGILGAALYDPVWLAAVFNKIDFIIIVTSFFFLERWKISPLLIVIFCLFASTFSRLYLHLKEVVDR